MPAPIAEDLVLAYRKTLFVVLVAPELVVRVGESSASADALLSKFKAEGAVIISAWNPFSKELLEADNAQRESALMREVDRSGLAWASAEGRDPDGKWPSEASICVFDTSPTLADAWMRRFEQNAIVRIRLGQPAEFVFHPDLRPLASDPRTTTVPERPGNSKPTHSVYVIRLDPLVLQDKKFRNKNPKYVEGKPCVYVGMTGKTPDERFAQHKTGHKSNKYARKLGLYLSRRQFEHLNPMRYDICVRQEIALAERLRGKGWAVWQA